MAIQRYGSPWPDNATDLQIEMSCIQQGGQWTHRGATRGAGLFHHYRALQSLLWPEDDHHRWSDLILSEILKNTITAILGPKDSSKTHTASKFALCDYYCWPDETLILISSTDLRGLEMRVWGDIKSLHERACNRNDGIPGHVLESKHAICTDDLSDESVVSRDMRRGCLCVPCLSSSGQFTGIAKYVGMKQKRRRLIADECFPAGTLVDTPFGPKAIETIKPGDIVINAVGACRVKGTINRLATRLIRIRLSDGRSIVCTENHELFTASGWTKAVDINRGQYMLGTYESMSILRENVSAKRPHNVLRELPFIEAGLQGLRTSVHASKSRLNADFLQSELFSKMEHEPAGYTCPGLLRRTQQEVIRVQNSLVGPESRAKGFHVQTMETGQSIIPCLRPSKGGLHATHEEPSTKGTIVEECQSERTGLACQVQAFDGSDATRDDAVANVSKWNVELPDQDWDEKRKRIPVLLQSRFGISRIEAGCGSGWTLSSIPPRRDTRPEEGQFPSGSWVEDCEILEQEDCERIGGGKGGITVYNLHVEEHHTYSVNGLLVSNCQFMHASFLESLANLNSGDFKGVFMGNPLGQDDPLDKISEPKAGWTALTEPEKTATWDNRFLGGRTINLVGTDSPNFDADTKGKYSYLINQKSIDNVTAFYGMESSQYYSQCKGVRRSGLNARRVITRELCDQFHAFDEIDWKGETLTKIAAMDAAYGGVGGDRCVLGHISFGLCTDDKIRVLVSPPTLVPVSAKLTKRPEDQIAEFTKSYCESNGIAPDNFFYDSTGRGSLGPAFARLWSPNIQPVEFGGTPTTRPVSMDLLMYDPMTRERRAKLCHEHYRKFVTELWFSVRYIIESDQMRGLVAEVAAEGYQREWKLVQGDRIEIESKEDMKKRTNRSPDLFDWLVTACEGARRRGFAISKLGNAEVSQRSLDWLRKMREDWRQIQKRHELMEV